MIPCSFRAVNGQPGPGCPILATSNGYRSIAEITASGIYK